jgi:hypothetical protein
MSIAEYRAVVEGYLDGGESRWLAEDVLLVGPQHRHKLRGRSEVSRGLAQVAGAAGRLGGRHVDVTDGVVIVQWPEVPQALRAEFEVLAGEIVLARLSWHAPLSVTVDPEELP